MSAAAGLTILAGLILYGLDARAGTSWLGTSFAIGLGIGAVFAFCRFCFWYHGWAYDEIPSGAWGTNSGQTYL